MTGNLISRLEALASWLASVTPPYVPPVVTDTDAHKIAADLREAIALLKEAGSALEPFAEQVENIDEWRDDQHIWESSAAMNLTAGNLRQASSVSATIREAGGG